MRDLTARILSGTRKSLFSTAPLFDAYEAVLPSEIERIEQKVRAGLPEDLKVWLLSAGYGDIAQTLSFRYDWFSKVQQGHLREAVIFAQDDLGNFYAYSQPEGRIIFFPRSSPEYADVAPSFPVFMEEFERRSFKLIEWMDSLPWLPYARDA